MGERVLQNLEWETLLQIVPPDSEKIPLRIYHISSEKFIFSEEGLGNTLCGYRRVVSVSSAL